MKSESVLIVVGRSGGHIFPAMAVAEALEQLSPNLKIHFIHSGTPMEKEFFSKTNHSTHSISTGALAGGSFVSKLKTLIFLPIVFLRAFFVIWQIRPRAVLGTGGAISGPVLLSAFLQRRRRAVWEGNAVCGLTNRLLAPFVPVVFTVFPDIPNIPTKKQSLCGYPLRKRFLSSPADGVRQTVESPARESLQTTVKNSVPKKEAFNALVIGGSQGSLRINQTVSQALQEEAWREGIFIFHQTGKKDFPSIREKYRNLKGVEAFPFSSHIRDYYEKCDVIFSRAGSGAIAEISAVGKALVLIPLSGTAGDHQLKNSAHLANKGQAENIPEEQFTPETFKNTLLSLKNNTQKREELSQKIQQRHNPNGASSIARWLIQNRSAK